MNPRYLLSELVFCARHGLGLYSRVRLATNCFCARIPSRWSQAQQSSHRVRVRIADRPVGLRLRNNGADVRTLITLIKDGEYDPPGFPWDTVRTIVDAGANIGVATCYFASRAPGARVIALEPEPKNLALLRDNIAMNGIDAEVVSAALWSRSGRMRLSVHGHSHSHALTEAGRDPDLGPSDHSVDVDTVDVPSIAARFPCGVIDLMKIDIEGAEREVLGCAGDWVRRVRNLLIEFHKNPYVSIDTFVAMLREYGFDVLVYDQQKQLIWAARTDAQ